MSAAATAANEARIPDADIAALERQLADLLGLQVRVAHSETGGTLTLTSETGETSALVGNLASGRFQFGEGNTR